MPWWGWVLIGVGVVSLGVVKISVFRTIMQRKQGTKKFTDED